MYMLWPHDSNASSLRLKVATLTATSEWALMLSVSLLEVGSQALALLKGIHAFPCLVCALADLALSWSRTFGVLSPILCVPGVTTSIKVKVGVKGVNGLGLFTGVTVPPTGVGMSATLRPALSSNPLMRLSRSNIDATNLFMASVWSRRCVCIVAMSSAVCSCVAACWAACKVVSTAVCSWARLCAISGTTGGSCCAPACATSCPSSPACRPARFRAAFKTSFVCRVLLEWMMAVTVLASAFRRVWRMAGVRRGMAASAFS